ncbi:MAG: hypothetical protein JWQ98_1605 [Chlorobi bacterium]|nr:hypothetical protein [Chlorobiota bacterium]
MFEETVVSDPSTFLSDASGAANSCSTTWRQNTTPNICPNQQFVVPMIAEVSTPAGDPSVITGFFFHRNPLLPHDGKCKVSPLEALSSTQLIMMCMPAIHGVETRCQFNPLLRPITIRKHLFPPRLLRRRLFTTVSLPEIMRHALPCINGIISDCSPTA